MDQARLVPGDRQEGSERVRVIVVDDDRRVREALVDMLGDAGFPARGFPDGPSALQQLRHLEPELIILDLMMPSMDGADFLAHLATLQLPRDIPVLIVSGIGPLVQGIDSAQVRDHNIRGVIAKPVQYATLVSEVRYIIGPPAGRA